MSDISNAKKYLILNIFSNYLAIFLGAVIAIWLTPYLIRTLGVAVYGVIPLAASLTTYFNLLANSIAQSVGRYVTVSFNKEDLVAGNAYFNTALGTLLFLNGILIIPAGILSLFFDQLFNIPQGHEQAARLLCFLVLLSSLIMAANSPFLVSVMITNRFYLQNFNRLFSKILRVSILLLCFVFWSPSLVYFGLSFFLMAIYLLVSYGIISKKIVPELKINLKSFSFRALKEMCGLSVWIVIESLGAMFYITVTYVIINVFLGSEQCGRYGPITELVMLFSLLGAAISNIFAPIAYRFIAKNEFDLLALQLKRALKFICLTMAYPIGIACGLAHPLLQRWLGEDFTDLAPLVLIIMIPWLISISTRPCSAVFRGLNKAKVPAIVTLALGFINVLLSIVLVSQTDLGLYGVGISLLICLTVKNLFFTTIYTALVTNTARYTYFREISSGSLAFTFIFFFGKLLSHYCFLATLPRLSIISISGALLYFPLCYLVFINKAEKMLIKSIIFQKR